MKKPRWLGFIVLLLLAARPVEAQLQQQTPAGSGEEEQAILKIVNTTEPQQRLALIESFLAKYPDSPRRSRAYAAAAEACLKQNDHTKVIEYGERALELSPKDAFTMILVATSLTESARPVDVDFQEKLNRAEEYARRALSILPELFDPANMKRRPEVPEEEYTRQRHYAEALAHGTLGFVFLQRRQYAEAKGELKQAIELHPNGWDYFRLGVAHQMLREWKDAETAYRQCIEVDNGAKSRCEPQLAKVQSILRAQETLKQPQPPNPQP